jgi:hypothetical protein
LSLPDVVVVAAAAADGVVVEIVLPILVLL